MLPNFTVKYISKTNVLHHVLYNIFVTCLARNRNIHYCPFHKISRVTETERVRWTERALNLEGNATLEALVITTLRLQVLGNEGQVLTL
jgi:hypothetical protein